MLKEFKPTLFFLLRFGAFYGLASILYGQIIKMAHPKADFLTLWTANQMYALMKFAGMDVIKTPTEGYPSIDILWKDTYAVSVFEGCNGFILGLLFFVFVVAFRGSFKKMLWFIPLGLFILYVMNMLRLIALTIIAVDYNHAMHFFHKYFFTGVIYAVILAMWYWWAQLNAPKKKPLEKVELT